MEIIDEIEYNSTEVIFGAILYIKIFVFFKRFYSSHGNRKWVFNIIFNIPTNLRIDI